MGFLTDEEISSLRINHMILHVVGDGDFRPELARVVEHEEFFIARILDTDISPVFEFEPNSETKFRIERIYSGIESFESGAQNLSRDFSRLHVGSSRDGAFFIFELSTSDPVVKIYSFIKYDYREAIEQSPQDAGGLLRRIVTAFIADKKAIQKSTLIRVINGTAVPNVSARDRMKQSPEIGDYFCTFLGVKRALSDKELNNKTIEVLRTSLPILKEILPQINVAEAFRVAQGILRDRQEINEQAIIDSVLTAAGSPDDEQVISSITRTIRRKIRACKIEGLEFRPDRTILQRPPLRKVRTTEGITLTYPDDAYGTTVKRTARSNGGETITIQTAHVTEDKIVRDSAR